ncbi:M20/M25/M40 family metallo-hydrolase [Nocardioides carbamazepini]|uniref:M20/M25/M40 family metallo-hydrolase n=1 Tax=Nocardioides carbamazepini TaxID=2854259 RepID=UPI002149EA28|nr:M20/M25/M40 family metallo-hydrolase [Nocardioides carbamazepini]MCR1784801.1 M20/M25/M40 family metallo-hydrolase [Nocardioides carbamazepini]
MSGTDRDVDADPGVPLSHCAEEAVRVLERTFELALIPAPPLDERDRAARVADWWRADGLDVERQPVGNLWARLRVGADPGRGAVVVAAHLDTVFSRDVRHGLRRDAGRVVGPGCGDDTVAVAALSVLDVLLPARTAASVWVLATVGEEGLGDLAGARAALQHPPEPVETFVALEGNYLGRVNVVGVGSVRKRVRVSGRGGHAWEDADAPSAVHAAAAMVHAIAQLPEPRGVRSSRNVGLLQGGESINSRAIQASFDVDLRAEDPTALTELDAAVDEIIGRGHEGVDVAVEPLGNRPAGRIDPEHPLVRTAVRALAEVGITAHLTAASTDANVAYAAGIAAVTLGITYGDGTHTEDEWIDPDAIRLGLHALARTITERSA